MSSSGLSRKKLRAPQVGELLERWKAGDSEAEAVLHEKGPSEVIPLLRTPDEIQYLSGPVRPLTPVSATCGAACLNVFLVPFTLGIGATFKSPIPLIVLFSAEVLVIMGVWWKRAKLAEMAERFVKKQLRHAELAEAAMGLFEDPRWDDAILEGVLLKQSDGPDLVRPPAHPIYPPAMRALGRIDAEKLQKHHDSLVKFLHGDQFDNHERMIMLILDAAARCGDKQLFRKVKGIAHHGVFDAVGMRIRAAAVKCVEAMEERFENEKRARTLLRPSDSVASDSGTLLHPAESERTDEAHLLRVAPDSMEP